MNFMKTFDIYTDHLLNMSMQNCNINNLVGKMTSLGTSALICLAKSVKIANYDYTYLNNVMRFLDLLIPIESGLFDSSNKCALDYYIESIMKHESSASLMNQF